MKRVLDKSVIRGILEKGMDSINVNDYIYDIELLYSLDLDLEEFRVISEISNKRKREKELLNIDESTVFIQGTRLSLEYKQNSNKYIVQYGSEKLIISRDLLETVTGISLETDRLEAFCRIYDNIPILREFNKKKCTSHLFKRLVIKDEKYAELQYIMVISTKNRNLTVVEMEGPAMLDYKQFGFDFEAGYSYLVFESGVYVRYTDVEDTLDIISGDFTKANKIDISYSYYHELLEKHDNETIQYIFSISENQLGNIFEMETNVENGMELEDLVGRKSAKLRDSFHLKAGMSKLANNPSYLQYKIKEFQKSNF